MYITLVMVAFLFYGLCYAGKKDTLIYKNRENIYLTVCFLLAALVMGLRGLTVGADTLSYYSKFNDISSSSWSRIFFNINLFRYNGLEIGYVFVAKVCSMIINDYAFLQFVLSIIYCFAMMNFLKENVSSKIILTTVFLGSGLYLVAFNINRQMIAVALTALSWNCLCQGKKIKAIILLLLAVTFHLSSFVFVVAYFFYIIRKRKIIFGIAIFAVAIAAINYKSVINFVSLYVNGYANYWGNNRTRQTIGMSIIIFIIVLTLAIYILLQKNKFTMIEKAYAVFSAIYVICNFIGVYFNYFERIGVYFLPFVILEIDAVAQKMKSKDVYRLYVSGVSICYSLYFLVSSGTAQYTYKFL